MATQRLKNGIENEPEPKVNKGKSPKDPTNSLQKGTKTIPFCTNVTQVYFDKFIELFIKNLATMIYHGVFFLFLNFSTLIFSFITFKNKTVLGGFYLVDFIITELKNHIS